MVLIFIVSAGRSLTLSAVSGKLFQSKGFSVNGFGNGFAPPMLKGLEGILASENAFIDGGLILSALTVFHLMASGSLNLNGLATGCENSVSSCGKGT